MTTLAEFMIIAGTDNYPPMLEKSLYDSWKSRMELYIKNQENGRMILNSVQNGPLIWPTIVEEDGTTRTKRVKLLMQGMKLSLQEKECTLYDEFDKFSFVKGDDPISCLNKAMAFLTAVASLRFPSTNNQLITSSNLRSQATIKDDGVTVQQEDKQGCYNCQGKGHLAKQCTQLKRPRNAAWFKEKAIDKYG
ncbi:retrovirus-related pol polyprotein from transposon TNT 1-94 [Tanacetum coccineum]